MGPTTDLKRRIKEHEGGLVLATSYRLPAKLVYYEACQSQSEVLRRELSSRPDLAVAITATYVHTAVAATFMAPLDQLGLMVEKVIREKATSDTRLRYLLHRLTPL